MKSYLLMLSAQLVLAAVCIVCSSCSFKVETGWHGRTGIDDQTISPEFRATSAKGKY